MSNRQTYSGGVYTEVDAGGNITLAANVISCAALLDTNVSYVYKNFGSAYFNGDFEHTLNFKTTGSSGTEIVYLWGMCNSYGAIGALITANNDLNCVSWENGYLVLTERNGSSSTTDTSVALAENTDYFLRIVRDETVGTYGTLYCYIYADQEYTELVDLLTVTLTESKDWQYLFALSAKGSGSGYSWTGTIANLTLDKNPYCLGQVRLTCRYLLNELVPAFYSETELNGWINDAVRDIAEKALCIQHIDSTTTTSGTRTVSFLGHKVEAVEWINGSERKALRKLLPNQIGRMPLLTGAAVPQWWFESGPYVGIDPKPDGTYTLALYVCDYPAADMTRNGDVPEIPPAFRPLTILYTLWRALTKDKKFQAAQQLYAIYLSELAFVAYDFSQTPPDSREALSYQ